VCQSSLSPVSIPPLVSAPAWRTGEILVLSVCHMMPCQLPLVSGHGCVDGYEPSPGLLLAGRGPCLCACMSDSSLPMGASHSLDLFSLPPLHPSLPPSLTSLGIITSPPAPTNVSNPFHSSIYQVTLGVIAFTIVILRVRRVNLRRDGQDYKGTATDVLNIMKNSDFEAHKAKVRFD